MRCAIMAADVATLPALEAWKPRSRVPRGALAASGPSAVEGRWAKCGAGVTVLLNETGADALAADANAVEPIPETSAAEQLVADVHAIGATVVDAERVRDSVPLWFHTFALAPGIYTPGIARDHGYRLAVLGADRFAGRSVLDIGAFDGFYSFLAEVRGARRVVAVDNEQYVDWVRARFGVTLAGGVGFRAIGGLIASLVEYRRMDALDVHELRERFDVALCFGILHRVSDPIALLRALAQVLAPGGEIVLETYGTRLPGDTPAIEVHAPGEVYARDDFVYWGFSAESLRRLARIVGLDSVEVVDEPEIDGHPRILALLRAAR
jgi:tRNA (mo5U34)-methyltransferase